MFIITDRVKNYEPHSFRRETVVKAIQYITNLLANDTGMGEKRTIRIDINGGVNPEADSLADYKNDIAALENQLRLAYSGWNDETRKLNQLRIQMGELQRDYDLLNLRMKLIRE